MSDKISLDEMRERGGRLIVFGNDWIGKLTDEESKLLESYLERQRRRRADGSFAILEHVKRLPSRQLAAQFDRALGKERRLRAQWATVETWLLERGMLYRPDRAGNIYGDRKRFLALIEAETKKQKEAATAMPRRQRGPKGKIGRSLVARMKTAVANGLTRAELYNMEEKDLEKRFPGGGRTSRREARDAVLAEPETPSNSDDAA